MSLKEALKQVSTKVERRRQQVIDGMKPVKKALLQYRRDLIVSDMGIKSRKGGCANRIVIDTKSGATVISVDSDYPGLVLVLNRNEQKSHESMKSMLLHVAELMVESEQ
tara:strand:+ start:6832 stop:7158 length:327 start_codon:yes stop_codon:yes gene_type:complete